MAFEYLEFEIKNQTGCLTVSRPRALNALNAKVLGEIEEFAKAGGWQPARALIIRGAGDRAFAAGADIKEMSRLSPSEAKSLSEKGQRAFSLIEALPLPVIAVIHGFALGGGLELALACDILVMEEKAKIGFPETALGLLPSFGGTQRLCRAIGFYKAKEMILTGNFYSAREALEMGLASALAPKEGLLKKAEAFAASIRKRGPLAVKAAKEILHKSRGPAFERGLEMETEAFGRLFESEDAKEGMRAFLEKRQPDFKGSPLPPKPS